MHCGEATGPPYVLVQVLYISIVSAIENDRFGFKNFEVL